MDYPPYSNVQRSFNRNQNYDIHEIMKTQIGDSQESSILYSGLPAANGQGLVPIPRKPAPIPPTVVTENFGFEDFELYFDSNDSNLSSDLSMGTISWTTGPMQNNIDIINNVVLHIGSFMFPNITRPANKPVFFYNLTAFMEITSLSSIQAVRASNGKVFHFEFWVSSETGQAVVFTPKEPSIYLRRPFNTQSEFSVRFWIPSQDPRAKTYQLIPIPRATINVVSVAGTNPLQFIITTPTVTTNILDNIGAVVAPGIAVGFYNYVSNDPAINAQVLDSTGNYVINIIDALTFEIGGIDGTTTAANYPAIMYIPKNRFAFEARFTTLSDKITNQVDINHS